MNDWTRKQTPSGYIGAGKLMQQLASERREQNIQPVPEFLRRQVVVSQKKKKKKSRKS